MAFTILRRRRRCVPVAAVQATTDALDSLPAIVPSSNPEELKSCAACSAPFFRLVDE